MLRSNLCDYSDVYIVVTGNITLTGGSNKSRRKRPLAFKNNAPFIGCISKINNVLTDNAEGLDVVMPIYNFLEYKTSITGSTYNADAKINNVEGNEIDNPAYDANKSGTEKVEIVVPLKYLSNFWRTLDMRLINCETELVLTWFKNCVITRMEKRVITNTRRDNSPTSATFQITDTKLYVPVVTLLTENDKKLLEQLKSGFKRTIKLNKNRSQITVQNNNNNLNYLIDPTFTKVNRLFVLSFEKIEENNVKKDLLSQK